jgi:hypothetical protein
MVLIITEIALIVVNFVKNVMVLRPIIVFLVKEIKSYLIQCVLTNVQIIFLLISQLICAPFAIVIVRLAKGPQVRIVFLVILTLDSYTKKIASTLVPIISIIILEYALPVIQHA